MPERRFKNWNWNVATVDGQHFEGVNNAQLLAVLMDIRSELQRLNGTLHCPNFLQIPFKLDRIVKNTKKKRKPKVTARPRLRAVS
jgi:hypothetical protein